MFAVITFIYLAKKIFCNTHVPIYFVIKKDEPLFRIFSIVRMLLCLFRGGVFVVLLFNKLRPVSILGIDITF